MGKIFVFVGPSGAGKTVITEALELPVLGSVTTREPREGEKDIREYNFVTEEEYMKLKEDGALLEDVNNYGFYYGITKKEAQFALDSALPHYTIMTYKGVEHLRPLLPEGSLVSVFVYAPFGSVYRRLWDRVAREELTQEACYRRLDAYAYECTTARKCDYIIASIDGCLDVAINTAKLIVQSCK